MATTPKGYPYPLGTDRVMDGDDAIHSLASTLDARLAGGVTSGYAHFVNAPPGVATSLAVTFPAGLFSVFPYVTMGIVSGLPLYYSAGVVALSPSGCSIVLFNNYTAAASLDVYWHAHTP